MKSLLLKAAKLKGIATSESNLLIVYLRDESGGRGGSGKWEMIWVGCEQFCLSQDFCSRMVARSSQEPALPRVKTTVPGAGVSKATKIQPFGC